jgi:hypothetical protein
MSAPNRRAAAINDYRSLHLEIFNSPQMSQMNDANDKTQFSSAPICDICGQLLEFVFLERPNKTNIGESR